MRLNNTVFFCILFLLFSCSKNTDNEKDILKQMFTKWIKNEISNGNFFAKDSCNMAYYNRHPIHAISPTNPEKDIQFLSQLGFPDSNKIKYFFADINNDQRLDGLMTFHPDICFATDTNINIVPEFRVLAVSGKNEYTIDDSSFTNIKADSTTRFFDIDSMAVNRFYGSYLTCVEDTNFYAKIFCIYYDTKKLHYIGDKKINLANYKKNPLPYYIDTK